MPLTPVGTLMGTEQSTPPVDETLKVPPEAPTPSGSAL